MINLSWHPTNKMMELDDSAEIAMLDTIEKLMKMARDCHDAMVNLPHVNEVGENVRQGANNAMTFRRDGCLSGVEAMRLGIRDLQAVDRIRFKYHYAGGKFRTKEEWDARFSHLD